MKIAITADWLPTFGGAEHMLAALHQLWPESPLYTTVAKPEALGPIKGADIRTDALLQKLFRLSGSHRWLLPWMPRAIERIDLTGYDVVLSSSHAVGKGVIVPSRAIHICYCHTPMRYAWEMEKEYLKDFGVPWPLSKFVKKELKKLRRWDLSTAKRVDIFIANSSETQMRIKKIYGRESIVIPPPVDAEFYDQPLSNPPQDSYLLAIGRLVPYKRFDLLVETANRLKLPLKIGGTGSELPKLKMIAGPTVEFLGFVPDEKLPLLYRDARALLFPQHEDAGIVPMEAQASGVPVVAYGQGGIVDVVVDGTTGILAAEQTVDSFASALEKFSATTFDRAAIREHAKKFHVQEFMKRMKHEVEMAYKNHLARRT